MLIMFTTKNDRWNTRPTIAVKPHGHQDRDEGQHQRRARRRESPEHHHQHQQRDGETDEFGLEQVALSRGTHLVGHADRADGQHGETGRGLALHGATNAAPSALSAAPFGVRVTGMSTVCRSAETIAAAARSSRAAAA